MASRFHWRLLSCPGRIIFWMQKELVMLRITFYSFFWNEFMSWTMVFETLFEPGFYLIDKFAWYFGPLFMALVVLLTTSVVVIFYTCLLPVMFNLSLPRTIFHLILGHWLLMNIVFNYFMAAFTHPGTPTESVLQVVSICKRCIAPKPPRTHHCSVCNRCILKMDHHCPWLNNCIGYFNHRYFFMFCVYMCLGTIYVSYNGYDVFKQHFYGNMEPYFPGAFYPINLARDVIIQANIHDIWDVFSIFTQSDVDFCPSNYQNSNLSQTSEVRKQREVLRYVPKMTIPQLDDRWNTEVMYHNAVVYEFILCSAVTLALALLSLWHGRLISRAETSIEVHINKKERKRKHAKNLIFKNPYNFGFKKNWKIFLGLSHGRTFWRHILFPSTHRPSGNGLTWETSTYQLYDHHIGLQLL